MTRISSADIESDEEEEKLAPNINETQQAENVFPVATQPLGWFGRLK